MIPIPDAALEKHIGILGTTGSGKSNVAKLVAGELMDRGERVCVLDPTGTWWGMRLNADGSQSPYPMVIFGGERGDIPNIAPYGQQIAQTVGTSSTPCIIDMRGLTKADQTRFFTGFAETLLRVNQGVLTLIIDEAHLFAPQGGARVGGGAPAMLHAANNLVALGRGVGLRIVLVSQRAAKLHKDSLTQVQTLIAMRVMAPQDRRAVNDWIGEWADAKDAPDLMPSLPSMKTGEAWVWSPEIGHLECAEFPLVPTFDTGKVTEARAMVLPKIDLDAVSAHMQEVSEEMVSNDPRRMRERIRELERELAKRPDPGPEMRQEMAALREDNKFLRDRVQAWREILGDLAGDAQQLADRLTAAAGEELPMEPVKRPVVDNEPPPVRHKPRSHQSVAHNSSNGGSPPNATLTGPQQRVVNAIAWFEGMHLPNPNRVQVAFMAGYKPNGGAFNNVLGSLRSAGHIEYLSEKRMKLTGPGHELAEYPKRPGTATELHNAVMEKLTGPQRRVLEPLIYQYPGALGYEELAGASGYTASGGAFNNVRGTLRSLGLIDYPERGMARAEDVLFP